MADHLLLWTAYGSGLQDRRLLKGHSEPQTWLRCRIWPCMRIKAAPLSLGRPARRAPYPPARLPPDQHGHSSRRPDAYSPPVLPDQPQITAVRRQIHALHGGTDAHPGARRPDPAPWGLIPCGDSPYSPFRSMVFFDFFKVSALILLICAANWSITLS
jgi:hypothetical protein